MHKRIKGNEEMPEIICYHTNDKERCERFLQDINYTINSPDETWLGFGMYFWDNLTNAEYWAAQKKHKDKTKTINEWQIVQATVDIEKLLDLQDEQIMNRIDTFWKGYCRLKKCNELAPLGKKIDILIDFFSILSIYTVLRCFGVYPKMQSHTLFKNSLTCFVASNIKSIYCVRPGNSGTIDNRDLVKVV